jgi:hypothetical protein
MEHAYECWVPRNGICRSECTCICHKPAPAYEVGSKWVVIGSGSWIGWWTWFGQRGYATSRTLYPGDVLTCAGSERMGGVEYPVFNAVNGEQLPASGQLPARTGIEPYTEAA